jgi:hypothetical protein
MLPPVVLAFRFFFPLKIYLVVRPAAVVNNVEKAAANRGKHRLPSGRFAPCAPSLRAGLSNGWPSAMPLKRGEPRSRCATVAARTGTSAARRSLDSQKNKQPRQEGIHRLAYGQRVKNKARQAARCESNAEVRHCLSVPTGKPAGMAASGHPCGALRPGQITPGRQVGRPFSPARVRAMPETFVVIERPIKTV